MNQELIDFKESVKSMIQEAVLRLDDLRNAESRRIDQIRSIDIAALSVANDKATIQASVLASQVSQAAETLRQTALTVAQQLNQMSSQFNERLALLEKAQYTNTGSSGGHRDMYGWAFGIVVAVIGFGITIYFALNK